MDHSTPGTSRKLTRASRPKARTGCLTCKLRHVKCDEQKPQCLRCTSLGRRCGGYKHLSRANIASREEAFTSERQPSSLTVIRPLVVFVADSPDERRAIEFFHHKAAPQLSGYFHQRFWSELVLQVSVDEPAVRHAMIALSSIYEGDVYKGSSSPEAAITRQGFALESYNRAIRHLVTKMRGLDSVRVPLITCIIFVCIDCLRRDIPIALNHIEGGMKLLGLWRQKHHDPNKRDELLSSVDFEIVEEQLVPMFAWLNMATAIFGRPSFSVASLSANPEQDLLSTKKPFRTIFDAISSFLNLIDPAIKLIQANGEKKYAGTIGSEPVAEQARLLVLIDDWYLSFEHLIHDERANLGGHVPNRYNVILACTMSVRVWLEACLSPYETVWDGYKSQFEEMVRLAEPVISDSWRFPDEYSKSFSFELGIIPPLQFVAWKCRWPSIRRKALNLLRTAPKRECVFDSSYSFALYERVRVLEEASLGMSTGQNPAEEQLPPEEARIHVIDLPPLLPTPNGRAVNFLTRPNGPDHGWTVRSEYLNLSGLETLSFSDKKGDDHVETSTTGLWASNLKSASQLEKPAANTVPEPYTPSVSHSHDRSSDDDISSNYSEMGGDQVEVRGFRCHTLGPIFADTSTVIYQKKSKPTREGQLIFVDQGSAKFI